MFSKINSKYFLITFAILLAVFLLVKRSDNKKAARTFDPVLANVAFDEVTDIRIQPKQDESALSLFMEDERWKVKKNGQTYNANQSAIQGIVKSLNNAQKDRLAAVSDEKWKKYEVTDSLGTRITIKGGKEVLVDVILGSFSYKQAPPNPNSQTQQMQQQQGMATSYVRTVGEKKVYAVNGYLSISLKRDINNFRDKTVLKGNSNNWSKITVTHPGDSSFVLKKQAEKWLLNDNPVDSASVTQYLLNLQNLSGTNFGDDATISTPEHAMLIEGEDLAQPIEVKATQNNDKYLITSSLNKGTVIVSDANGIFKKLFASRPKN